MAAFRLTVAPDPALAVVVRIFVGAVTERLEVDPSSRDDLRLAASEVFAAAVEAGRGEDLSVTIEREDDVVAVGAGVDASDRVDPDAWQGRLELVRALFPDAEVGRTVRIAVPVVAPTSAG